MRSRSPLLLVLALVVALTGACAGDGELGGPTVGGTPAASIGEHSVSNGDLEEEVELWASNPTMLQAIGVMDLGAPGRRSTALVSFVLSHRVVSEQARLLLADARVAAGDGTLDLAAVGLDGEALAEPSDADVDGILDQLDAQFTGPEGFSMFAGFSEDFRRRLARDLAYQDRLQFVLQVGIEPPTVSVNPRYGTVQVLQGGIAQVEPPTGSRPAPLRGA